MAGEVLRAIRQHARAHLKAEVCGVLIGEMRADSVVATASIAGLSAAQAGTHVTFTQDTWGQIYKVKDRDYPGLRIVGWYHSHPGFGVFLSSHDTFIHENFFSAPAQIAWVYDPHSEEEGLFVWNHGRIERAAAFEISDQQGGQVASGDTPEPALEAFEEDAGPGPRGTEAAPPQPAWMRWTTRILTHLAVLLIGLAIGIIFFVRERIVFVAPPAGTSPQAPTAPAAPSQQPAAKPSGGAEDGNAPPAAAATPKPPGQSGGKGPLKAKAKTPPPASAKGADHGPH
jgi:proteasome lid subunit RPN8/RPN11